MYAMADVLASLFFKHNKLSLTAWKVTPSYYSKVQGLATSIPRPLIRAHIHHHFRFLKTTTCGQEHEQPVRSRKNTHPVPAGIYADLLRASSIALRMRILLW